MTAFQEDRALSDIIQALQRLGGLATIEEIEGQMSRSGAMRLPPTALAQVVSLTIHQNVDGRGMGKFARKGPDRFALASTTVIPRNPTAPDRRDRQ